jgi:hypothetical protein
MLYISHPFRLLIGTVIAFTAFWTYGKVNFYRDPGSLLFYDSSRAYERKYSSYRETEVLAFRESILKKIESGQIQDIGSVGKDPEICAVIISVERKIEGFHPLVVCIYEHLINSTATCYSPFHRINQLTFPSSSLSSQLSQVSRLMNAAQYIRRYISRILHLRCTVYGKALFLIPPTTS